jgi:signal transduction histidine kinase
MNRLFFLLTSILILLVFLGSSWTVNQRFNVVFQKKASSIYEKNLKIQGELISRSISAQALIDDFVNARIQLEKLRVGGFIAYYRLASLRSATIQADITEFEESIKVSTPIFFKENGEKWGDLELWFPAREFHEALLLNQKKSTELLILNILILLLLIVGTAFLIARYSSILTKVVVSFFADSQENQSKGKLVSLLWAPFLRQIEAKAAELKKLKQSNDELQIFSLLTRVSQNLAHDMRAPLAVFERILNLDSNDDFFQMKPFVRQSLSRLNAMIEMLRHSEAEFLMNRAWSYIEFRHGLESLGIKASEKKITLIAPKDFRLWANVDASKFERSWINLASNAIDFAETEVRIEVTSQDRELILKVIDNGPGVSDEFLPKLFQRGATYGKKDGTGLGLAYVRQIMRGHGGDVTYRREKKLSIFECRLPNAVQPEKEQVVENSALLEPQLVQKQLCSVAICLEPKALTQSILAKLASYDSNGFLFSEERDGASIVVSNMDEVMFEVLERDDQEYISLAHSKGDENAIMMILRRKFNFEKDGALDV